ncbi:MAG: DUF6379 domain-containing protein [Gordonia sp. (in: high G+C Gram-positive bacteria)]
MFRDRIIVGDSLVARADEYSVTARIPWYRALPLSCLVEVTLVVDGEAVPTSALEIEVDGVRRPFAELAPLYDVWWYVRDDLIIHVAGRLADRAEHEVDLALALRIPYLPEADVPLVIRERLVITTPARIAADSATVA